MSTEENHPVAPAFREVMAAVCTPVSVITGLDDGVPHGTTVSAFASLSMAPPMVLVSLDRGSDLLALVRRTGLLGVNVLGSGQSELATQCARKGADKFTDVAWELHAGVPRIAGAAGFLGCTVAGLVPGGDHVIVLGDVVAAETVADAPLTYHGRVFGTHFALEGVTR
ncbi:flavin reductase family protein [Blastococcus saxobsidens]|uniref:Putative oxidoreductase flavin reductase domain protein, FMN-binding n=1 Tax=Blastococcus saxobsidens (strain DD2) TaxID=1146883 RepID=H6RLJ4_BLASD|nr:flavin reductase family protein [Blastococcus saxobsidens]CCG03720.1 Putative oxidoreductase; flavin reductase domain protein, FMN-binding [Blastococcus saxobsidens DD2]